MCFVRLVCLVRLVCFVCLVIYVCVCAYVYVCCDKNSWVTGAATLASGANYLLVSGLKPRGKLGRRFMVQREQLQRRYRQRELAVQEGIRVRRDRMRDRGVSETLQRNFACCHRFRTDSNSWEY